MRFMAFDATLPLDGRTMPLASKTQPHELTAIIQPDDDGYLAVCPEVDVVAGGETTGGALANLLEALRDYAEEYLADQQLYERSPNRSHHLAYVRAIAATANERDLLGLFGR